MTFDVVLVDTLHDEAFVTLFTCEFDQLWLVNLLMVFKGVLRVENLCTEITGGRYCLKYLRTQLLDAE